MGEIRRLIRVAGADLNGTLSAERALRKIYGIGFMTGKAFCTIAGIDPKQKLGLLADSQIKTLESIIVGQALQSTLLGWLANRCRSHETGGNIHLVGDNLKMRQREDINLMKRIRIYKGIRHELGLPVRGQKTKSTGRVARTVGVIRSKAAPAAAKPAAAKPTEKK
jgi:small subunit ribosomal protein S13